MSSYQMGKKECSDRVLNLIKIINCSKESADDNSVRQIFEDLGSMLDIYSIESLKRAAYNIEPKESPYIDECNSLLSSIDVTMASSLALVSLIRLTSSRRKYLSAWKGLADDITEEFKKREPDRWKSILIGIAE